MSEKLPKPMLEALMREAKPMDHPSADLLAAFAERTLTERERLPVAEHVARCAECREVVFLASAAAEAEAKEQAGELVVAASRRDEMRQVAAYAAAPVALRAAREEPPRRRRWWVWAAPLAAVVVLGVGLFVWQSPSKTPPQEMASSRAPEVAKQPQSQGSEPPQQAASPRQTTPTPVHSAKPQPSAKTVTSPLPKEVTPKRESVVTMYDAASPPLASEAAQTRAAKPARQSAAIDSGGPMAGAVSTTPRSNAFAGANSEQMQQYGANDTVGLAANRLAANTVRTSHPWWRVTPQGHLEHLTTEGWTRELTDQGDAYRVVAVIGSDVWAGGNEGMLYHSSDNGQHWNRVALAARGGPETAAIVSIRFNDALHGVVTTDSGATYSTSDGGTTWSRH